MRCDWFPQKGGSPVKVGAGTGVTWPRAALGGPAPTPAAGRPPPARRGVRALPTASRTEKPLVCGAVTHSQEADSGSGKGCCYDT